nr:G-patch domain-containing protein [Ipomoea batatas]
MISGEKKKHRKEMIASKRRERMIRRGVDLQKINAKLEKMVLDGADMLSFEPMHTKDCSQVRKLASVYRLWSGCQGSGKKRFVTVARTHHTCMPSANDRVRVEKLIGANDEDDDFTVNGVPANKPSRGSYTTSTPRDSKSSQIKSLKSLSNSGGNKDSSRKKRNGKTGSYSSQPVSFISSGIMSSEKVELKITESTESSDGCHEKKCVSNYGAFELHTTGFGSKMMVKMGFTGGGLGKDGQGIAEPIQVSQRPKTLGLGADIPETSTANETMTPTPKSVVFREDLPTRSRKSGQKGSQGQKAQYGSPGFGAFENHTKGFGSKMMAKMGFVEGTGLGKDSQGITAPILATRRPKSQGLGAKR